MRVIGDDAWLLLGRGRSRCSSALVGAGVAATSRLRVWPLAVPLMWVLVRGDARPRAARRVPVGPPGLRADRHDAHAVRRPRRCARRSRSRSRSSARCSPSRGSSGVGRARPSARSSASPCSAPRAGSCRCPPRARTVGGRRQRHRRGDPGQRARARAWTSWASGRPVLRNHVAETERLAADVAAGRVAAARPRDLAGELQRHRPARATRPRTPASSSAVDAIDVPGAGGRRRREARRPDAHLEHRHRVGAHVDGRRRGPPDFYVKQHPVPFGEWVPAARTCWRRLIGRFDRVPRDFAPGDDAPASLQVGPARLGDLICFEVAYDELGARGRARRRREGRARRARALPDPGRADEQRDLRPHRPARAAAGDVAAARGRARPRGPHRGHERHQRDRAARTARSPARSREFAAGLPGATSVPLRDDLTVARPRRARCPELLAAAGCDRLLGPGRSSAIGAAAT